MNYPRFLQKKDGRTVFCWALLLASCIFVPLMLYNRGYFLFLGDFNVQQIPFYQLAHRAVRSGEIFWSHTTDLGANFIGSYSFYLLFSPFFWLTLPFPTAFVPHLMGPLLILKTALAAYTAYLYIKRFVPAREWAMVGGILYAFSGFMTFNIFFNHFHDVCVFFPLLLVALEELVTADRRGWFAVAVAVNCLVNYWFFIGEVVFVILYVVVRICTGGWGCTPRKFLQIAAESIIGVLLAGIGFLPSVLAIVGNPRTDGDNLLAGWLLWIYGFQQRFPAILQSFFFPPEMPSRPNFFPDMGAKWASLSAWLPLFSATGVIAFCQAKRRNFHKRMILLSMIFALVPALNALFVLMNHAYYARWFYMPILMLSVATATALSERERLHMRQGWRSGFCWVGGIVVSVSLAIGFSPIKDKEGNWKLGLYGDQFGFLLNVLTAVLCLILAGLLIFGLSKHSAFYRMTAMTLSGVIVLYTLGYLISGKSTREKDDWFIDHAIRAQETLELPDEDWYRTDFYKSMDNLGMFWGLPNIQAFHSIVPTSLMEFYPAIGVKRDVSSKPDLKYTALRSLLSVKYLFVKEDLPLEEQPKLDHYQYAGSQLDYHRYENEYFLPMGFGYETAATPELTEALSGVQRSQYLLHALALSPEAIERNADILTVEENVNYEVVGENTLPSLVEERRALACTDYQTTRRGFTAKANLPAERLVFFSVPYDQGWSAVVNGQPAVIERANLGFMAVRVPAGEATIAFTYLAPGLKLGIGMSLVGLLLLLGIFLPTMKKSIRSNKGETI